MKFRIDSSTRLRMHHRVLLSRPEPQVAVLKEEVRPVLLQRDRIVLDVLDRRHARDFEFVAARRARLGLHLPAHVERRLLP
jgi:hypothetical protein